MEWMAVLASGGLDSCALLADLSRSLRVQPLYIQFGLIWEAEERRALERFLESLGSEHIAPPVYLQIPVGPVYGDHWSLSGTGIPGPETQDLAVFLPGRNVLMLSLAATWCSLHQINRIGLGSLADNPFPDATEDFLESFAAALTQGLAHRVRVETPYRGLKKFELIRRFPQLPWGHTLTCLRPFQGRHCGDCNKCRERQQAFHRAQLPDPTCYRKVQPI